MELPRARRRGYLVWEGERTGFPWADVTSKIRGPQELERQTGVATWPRGAGGNPLSWAGVGEDLWAGQE